MSLVLDMGSPAFDREWPKFLVSFSVELELSFGRFEFAISITDFKTKAFKFEIEIPTRFFRHNYLDQIRYSSFGVLIPINVVYFEDVLNMLKYEIMNKVKLQKLNWVSAFYAND